MDWSFLPKEDDLEFIEHCRSITLLNLSYNFFAKVLQTRLHNLLPEVINDGQAAFLSARYILNTILVQQETIAWVQASEQSLIMLKLDFSKAYDTVF